MFTATSVSRCGLGAARGGLGAVGVRVARGAPRARGRPARGLRRLAASNLGSVARRVSLGPRARLASELRFPGKKPLFWPKGGSWDRAGRPLPAPASEGRSCGARRALPALRLFELGLRLRSCFAREQQCRGAGKEWKTKYRSGERGQRKRNSPAFFTPKARRGNASAENANWFVFLLLRFIKSGTQSPNFRAHVGRKATAPFLTILIK